MNKHIAAASIATVFLASVSPAEARLTPPDYRPTGWTPARQACLEPFMDVSFNGKNYYSDGNTVAVTKRPLGAVVFVSDLIKEDTFSCRMILE